MTAILQPALVSLYHITLRRIELAYSCIQPCARILGPCRLGPRWPFPPRCPYAHRRIVREKRSFDRA